MGQAAPKKVAPQNPDEVQQQMLQELQNSPYENAKHERWERTATNTLTPEMRDELTMAKNKATIERKLASMITLRDAAIANGTPTGKYDAQITTLEGLLGL